MYLTSHVGNRWTDDAVCCLLFFFADVMTVAYRLRSCRQGNSGRWVRKNTRSFKKKGQVGVYNIFVNSSQRCTWNEQECRRRHHLSIASIPVLCMGGESFFFPPSSFRK